MFLLVIISLLSYCWAESDQCEAVRQPIRNPVDEDLVNAISAKLMPEIAALKSQMNGLREETRSGIATLSAKVDALTNAANYYDSLKVSTALNASDMLDLCGATVTSHGVIYRGRVATIVPRHASCKVFERNEWVASSDIAADHLKLLTPSDTYDVALFHNGCPSSASALLLPEKPSALHLGDSVIAGGYMLSRNMSSKLPRTWAGTLSGYYDMTVTNTTCVAFTRCALLSTDMLLFAGIQLGGMSGAPVLNGCGYMGLAIGSYNYHSNNASHVLVVPNYAVYDLLESNYESLIPLEDCPGLIASAIPTYPGRHC